MAKTEFQPVASSWIESARYNKEQATLDVQLQDGRRYRVQGVTPTKARGIRRASSAGGYYNRNLKPLAVRRTK